MKVTFTNNSDEVRDSLRQKLEKALKIIGENAEGYAKDDCPVDTGRLRNSITYAIRPEEQAVYIGTNVEYGKYVEFNEKARHDPPDFGGGKAHFLRDAVLNHTDEYKEYAETVMKEA